MVSKKNCEAVSRKFELLPTNKSGQARAKKTVYLQHQVIMMILKIELGNSWEIDDLFHCRKNRICEVPKVLTVADEQHWAK